MNTHIRMIATLTVLTAMVFAPTSMADTYYWTGANGTTYSDSGNWHTGTVPSNADYGDFARFADTYPPDGDPVANKTPNNTGGRKVQGIIFDSTGWTFSGQQMELRTISSSGSGTNTITALIKLYQDTTPTLTAGVGNTLDLAGGVYQDGSGKTFRAKGGGTIQIAGGIDGWSSNLQLDIEDAIVRIASSTPYQDGGAAHLTLEDSILQLQASTTAVNDLISNGKIVDDTGFGLAVSDIGGGYSQISVVPEPASLALMGLGGLALLGGRWRRDG